MFGIDHREVVGQNISDFIIGPLKTLHSKYLERFVKKKNRYTNYIPKTFAQDYNGFIIPISIFTKLSTDCFDSLGIAAFVKTLQSEDMYICTDLKGNLIGWTRSVYNNMNLTFLTSLQLSCFNIMLCCPHLIDFYFPKKQLTPL